MSRDEWTVYYCCVGDPCFHLPNLLYCLPLKKLVDQCQLHLVIYQRFKCACDSPPSRFLTKHICLSGLVRMARLWSAESWAETHVE